MKTDGELVREPQLSDAQRGALLVAVPDLVFLIGRDAVYHVVKAERPADLAAPPAELVGSRLHDVLPPDVADRIMAAADEAFAAGGVVTVDYELVLAGETRAFEGRVAPCGSDEFLMIVRDFTERVLQEEELRRSRARIVEAGDNERRRLERNLHDGAQQQLVAVSHWLRFSRRLLDEDPARAGALLDQAIEALSGAHEQLRELARGLHPVALTERGLEPALHAVVERSPVPVELDVEAGRLPGQIETALYYVVAESLTNVSKYARATKASVRIERVGAVAVATIRDDGVGGASAASGSGLRGLADRVEALGGTFTVESPAGGGTELRAELPLS